MASIQVTRGDDDGTRFSVVVHDEHGSDASYHVTVSADEWERFGAPYDSREQLVEASFRFLIEREPNESILRSFELGAIERYFPDYPRTIAAGGHGPSNEATRPPTR
jgi:hypothetical protein